MTEQRLHVVQRHTVHEDRGSHLSLPQAEVFDAVGKPLPTSLASWHAQGLEAEPLLPALSTYLGHVQPAERAPDSLLKFLEGI